MLKPESVFFGVLLLLGSTSISVSADLSASGREPWLWEDGSFFLIVAHVTAVEQLPSVPDEGATHVLTLEPIATVAGNFDPSRTTNFRARLAAVKYGSSVHEPPARGAIVLTLISRPSNVDDKAPESSTWIATELCGFMPDHAALITLSGLDDKRIVETLERVRKARVAGEAEAKAAAKRAETKPAPQPGPVPEENPKLPVPKKPASDPHASTR